MALQSKLFRDDERLHACLVNNAAHVQRGASGDHVAKMQQALRILMEDDGIDIDDDELKSKENFSTIRRGIDESFPKQFWPPGTFKGSSIGFFAAFVDAWNPGDKTVRCGT
jgi:hypothetical protein